MYKNCTIFFSLRVENKLFSYSFSTAWKYVYFYEKEVVLRAYVYSSDFINRRDNWSTYTEDISDKKEKKEEENKKNAWDCNFL